MDSTTTKSLNAAEDTHIRRNELLTFLDEIAPFERLILSAVEDDCSLYKLTKIAKSGRLLIADVLASLDENILCDTISSIYYDRDQLNVLLVCAPSDYSEFRNSIKRLLYLSQVGKPQGSSKFQTYFYEHWPQFRIVTIITFTISILLTFFAAFIAKIGFEGSTFFIQWTNTAMISNTAILMVLSAAITWLITYKG